MEDVQSQDELSGEEVILGEEHELGISYDQEEFDNPSGGIEVLQEELHQEPQQPQQHEAFQAPQQHRAFQEPQPHQQHKAFVNNQNNFNQQMNQQQQMEDNIVIRLTQHLN